MSDNSQFRTVLRGYDPQQVESTIGELTKALEAARREAADRTVELTKAQSAHHELTGQLSSTSARVGELEETQRQAASPTYKDLGERISSILSLADEEAQEMRGVATLEAQKHRDETATHVASLRSESDRYAEDVRGRAEAEAARIIEEANKSADTMIDHADRESAARREEAEALFESQRAKAAGAAADFETTLAARRDRAAAEFSAQLATHEESLTSAQTRAAQLSQEADAAHQEARTTASSTIESAKEDAALVVQQAREQADRIRRDSERELAAATARRDSINAQLTNVRQMLATLGGAALAQHVVDPADATVAPVAEAPVAGAPVAEAPVAEAPVAEYHADEQRDEAEGDDVGDDDALELDDDADSPYDHEADAAAEDDEPEVADSPAHAR